MKAWYFAPPGEKLRFGDDRKISVGHMHTVKEQPVICYRGLHGSTRLLDALVYAASPVLYRVEITRHLVNGHDKICGQRRQYIARIDATEILHKFARNLALIHISLIRPYTNKKSYDIIVEYLNTGRDDLRVSAYNAALAAYDAARAAAHAARAAAAAYDAARAAYDAARAAYDAALDAAHAARAAAAAYDAARAAYDAARAAYHAAARNKANQMLTDMVMEELKKQGYTE